VLKDLPVNRLSASLLLDPPGQPVFTCYATADTLFSHQPFQCAKGSPPPLGFCPPRVSNLFDDSLNNRASAGDFRPSLSDGFSTISLVTPKSVVTAELLMLCSPKVRDELRTNFSSS